MKNKSTDNSKINKLANILSYIIAIIIIFNCNTVYISSSNFTLFQKLQFPAMICVSLIYIFIQIKIYNLYIDECFLFGIIVSIYISLFLLFRVSRTTVFSNFKIIISFFIVFLLVWSERKKVGLPQVLKAYINVIVVIAGTSVVLWVLGSWLHFINPNKSVILAWGNPQRMIPSYHNVYFETQYINNIPRNSAIFVEAPLAALNFLIALSLNFLLEKQTKLGNAKNIIITIAGILTLSTTMYIGIIILFIYKFVNPTFRNNFFNVLKIILMIIFVPILFLIINNLIGSKLDTQSGIDRKLDYANAFSAWVIHPFWGNGMDAGINEGLTMIDGNLISHYGFSSSFTKILGDGGIYILVLFIFSIISSLYRSIKLKNWGMLVFTFILIYLFLVNIFAQTYIMFYLFIFIAIGNLNNYKLKNLKL